MKDDLVITLFAEMDIRNEKLALKRWLERVGKPKRVSRVNCVTRMQNTSNSLEYVAWIADKEILRRKKALSLSNALDLVQSNERERSNKRISGQESVDAWMRTKAAIKKVDKVSKVTITACQEAFRVSRKAYSNEAYSMWLQRKCIEAKVLKRNLK